LLVRLGRSWILSALPSADVGEKAGQEDLGAPAPPSPGTARQEREERRMERESGGPVPQRVPTVPENEKAVTVRTVTAELMPN
jgi:hypothetical protein